jgi:hypothetical protein
VSFLTALNVLVTEMKRRKLGFKTETESIIDTVRRGPGQLPRRVRRRLGAPNAGFDLPNEIVECVAGINFEMRAEIAAMDDRRPAQ